MDDIQVLNKNSGCRVRDLGLIEYNEAYTAQRDYVNELVRGGTQSLVLCEHPPTLTLGRSSDEQHILIESAELDQRRSRSGC